MTLTREEADGGPECVSESVRLFLRVSVHGERAGGGWGGHTHCKDEPPTAASNGWGGWGEPIKTALKGEPSPRDRVRGAPRKNA